MSSLQKISDVQEIHNLFASYGHHADSHNGEGFSSLFTENAVIDMSNLADFAQRLRTGGATFLNAGFVIEGREAIANAVRLQLPKVGAPVLRHTMSNVWIKELSDEKAEVEAYFVVFGNGDGGVEHYGTYVDTLVRCADGRWRISHHAAVKGYERQR